MTPSTSMKRPPAGARPSEPEPLWLPLPDPPSAPPREPEPEPEAEPDGDDEGDGIIVVEMA